MRILLIDPSEQVITETLATSEVSGKLDVIHSRQLYQALLTLEEEHDAIDVIILEIGLPECAGLTTLKLVLTHARGIPVIVVTSIDNPDTRTEAFTLGADDFVIKCRMTPLRLEHALIYASERRNTCPEPCVFPDLCGAFRCTRQNSINEGF
jgi:DNA-binding response OmpR family regulator